MPKLTRTHIVLILLFAMAIITVNAVVRVRYFGAKEREYRLSLDGGSGTGAGLGDAASDPATHP